MLVEAMRENYLLVLAIFLASIPLSSCDSESSMSNIAFNLQRRLQKLDTSETFKQQRFLEPDKDNMLCDAALFLCRGTESCTKCFTELKSNDVDWASISKGVSCRNALPVVYDHGHCLGLKSDVMAEDTFCVAFDACVNPTHDDKPGNATIDCSRLDLCDFDGIHRQFLGDGVCHEYLSGCYNTMICGWDGGDCCADTCSKSQDSRFEEMCGSEGYVCRDPASMNCDPAFNSNCQNGETDNTDQGDPLDSCEEGRSMYRLVMFDSFGDGWEATTLSISESSSHELIFQGGLENGSWGTSFICLSSSQMCYSVEMKGGMWGKECSWELRPLREGAPALASGGGPMACEFGVAGGVCADTCTGKTANDPTKDPDYKSFKDMYKCVQKKCPIQMATCNQNDSCSACFKAEDDTPAYCYGLDLFNAVIKCSVNQCNEDGESKASNSHANSGITPPLPPNGKIRPEKPCTSAETIRGTAAVFEFSNCTNFDEMSMLVLDFDQNHFGDLDTFEACAHAYQYRENHDGRTAQDCMRVLVNAMNGVTQVKQMDEAMSKAIGALSRLLYQDASNFCECANRAIKLCPMCPSFANFKTLLYEIVDACIALDQIDCDAWNEFYDPCQRELMIKFSNVDFRSQDQCDYVHQGCGSAGPFPSFRRLDCQAEVSIEAWKFYESFSASCLEGDDNPSPPPAPVDPHTFPTPDEPNGNHVPRPYVPPEKRGKDSSPSDNSNESSLEPPEKKPKESTTGSHFFRHLFTLLLLSGGGFLYYQRYGLSCRGFQEAHRVVSGFIRARRRGGQNEGGDLHMYAGISLESSANFQSSSIDTHQYI